LYPPERAPVNLNYNVSSVKLVIQQPIPATIFVAEDDPTHILAWEQVATFEQICVYYRQRLGPHFRDIPFLHLERDLFIALLRGKDGILADIFEYVEDVGREVRFLFLKDRKHTVLISLNIESPGVASQIIDYVEAFKRNSLHENFLIHLRLLAEKCRALHKVWLRDQVKLPPLGYHRIRYKPENCTQCEQDACESEDS